MDANLFLSYDRPLILSNWLEKILFGTNRNEMINDQTQSSTISSGTYSIRTKSKLVGESNCFITLGSLLKYKSNVGGLFLSSYAQYGLDGLLRCCLWNSPDFNFFDPEYPRGDDGSLLFTTRKGKANEQERIDKYRDTSVIFLIKFSITIVMMNSFNKINIEFLVHVII